MKRHFTRRSGAAALLAVALLGGCQSNQKIREAGALARLEYQQELEVATTAINAGDLDAARVHLNAARQRVSTRAQAQKVDDLDQLVAGAEALMAGDPAKAKDDWSQINDPQLGPEVRTKARMIGMVIPESTPESEKK